MPTLIHVRELLDDWSLLVLLVLQDLKLKYRGTALGFLWALLNPLLMLTVMAVAFTFVFHRHYPLHLFATLLPWQFFQSSLVHGSQSLTSFSNVILHWKTPLLLFPARKTLFFFFEYLFALVGLSLIAWFLGFRLTPSLLVLPLSMLLLLTFALSLAVIMSVTAVYFRDLQQVLDVLLRAGFYLSPVLIPSQSYPEPYRWVLTINPMYYFLELFDAPIARGEWPTLHVVQVAGAIAVLSLPVALVVFDRNESKLSMRL